MRRVGGRAKTTDSVTEGPREVSQNRMDTSHPAKRNGNARTVRFRLGWEDSPRP